MIYEKFLTYEDIKSRGYDLKKDGRLNQGDFNIIDEAINDFIREVVDGIFNLVSSYRGNKWTKLFFEDMQNINDDSYSRALEMYDDLRIAILDQAIFLYENGDREALAEIDNNSVSYSPKAIRRLWNAKILR